MRLGQGLLTGDADSERCTVQWQSAHIAESRTSRSWWSHRRLHNWVAYLHGETVLSSSHIGSHQKSTRSQSSSVVEWWLQEWRVISWSQDKIDNVAWFWEGRLHPIKGKLSRFTQSEWISSTAAAEGLWCYCLKKTQRRKWDSYVFACLVIRLVWRFGFLCGWCPLRRNRCFVRVVVEIEQREFYDMALPYEKGIAVTEGERKGYKVLIYKCFRCNTGEQNKLNLWWNQHIISDTLCRLISN